MTSHVDTTAKRIMAINWEGSFARTRSRVALLREYLRRAAWWAEAVKSEEWPFFDIAHAIKPEVRADPALVKRIETHLAPEMQGILVVHACVRALHFAALLDAGVQLPKLPGSAVQPFEPLLVMFERGGGFRTDGSGLIQVDIAGVPKGTIQSNLKDKPVVALDPAALDALDAAAGR